MWINSALNKSQVSDQPHIAKVMQVDDGTVNTQSHVLTINSPVITSIGVEAMPAVNDDVVLIPALDGKYYCIGKPVTNCAKNEVLLSSPSGGYIRILANGSISLNGLIISKEGVLNGN